MQDKYPRNAWRYNSGQFWVMNLQLEDITLLIMNLEKMCECGSWILRETKIGMHESWENSWCKHEMQARNLLKLETERWLYWKMRYISGKWINAWNLELFKLLMRAEFILCCLTFLHQFWVILSKMVMSKYV